MTTNNCEGCYTISTCRHTRHTEKYHRKCPCKQCIVKAICKDVCNEYLAFGRATRRIKIW